MLDAKPETVRSLAIYAQHEGPIYLHVAAVETTRTISDFCRLSKMLWGTCKAGSFDGFVVVEGSIGLLSF